MFAQKALLILAILATARANNRYGLPDEDGVGILDSESFTDFVNSRPFTLVLFVNRNENYNIEYWTQIKKVAEKVASVDGTLPVTFVDVATEQSIADELEIKGIPAIVLVSDKSRLFFHGQIEADAIYNWAIRYHRASNQRELKTLEDVVEVSKMRYAVLLSFPKGDNDQASNFAAAADAEPDIPFYFTHISLKNTPFDLGTTYSFFVFRTFDDGNKMMADQNPFASEYMRQFANMFKNPMIYPFEKQIADKVYTGNFTGLFYFAENFTAEKNHTFNAFAFQNRHKIKIYTCEFSDFSCMNLAYSVGHDEHEKHSVFILENEGKGLKRYKMKGKFSDADLTKFVDNYNKELLTPYAKSEAEPAENNGILKKVVRNTVSKMVTKEGKTVVLIGYSENPEWKDLEAIMEKMALKYNNNGAIDFVKYDASKNEHDNIFLTRVPQIQIYRKHNKNRPTVYLGKLKEAKLDKFFAEALKDELPHTDKGDAEL